MGQQKVTEKLLLRLLWQKATLCQDGRGVQGWRFSGYEAQRARCAAFLVVVNLSKETLVPEIGQRPITYR